MRAFGAFDDHVHVLLEIDRNHAIWTVARAIKSASSNVVGRMRPDLVFAWQNGYGAFSVSERDPDSVIAYIREQRVRHARGEIDSAWEPIWDDGTEDAT